MYSSNRVCHSRRGVASILFSTTLCLLLFLPVNSLADEASWSFAFFADSRSKPHQTSGVNSKALRLIARQIAKDIKNSNIKCELVLFGGDLIRGQSDENTTQSNLEQFHEWKQAMNPVYEAFNEKGQTTIPLYVVRGNHEVYAKRTGSTQEQALKDWMSAFGKDMPQNGPPPPAVESGQTEPQKGLNYFVKHKGVLFVAVDQYVTPGYDPSVNFEWLDKTLKEEKTGPHVFVFGHAPAWPAFKTRNDKSLFHYPELVNRFRDSISRGGCRVYLTGHQHYTAVNIIKSDDKPDMWQVMSGSAGAPLTKGKPDLEDPQNTIYVNNTDFGYYYGEVNGLTVTLRFRYFSGTEKRWKSDEASVVQYTVQ